MEATETKEDYYCNSTPLEKKASGQIITRYPISQAIKTVGISSLLVFGFVLALGSSIPETSPDTGSVVYYPHIPYNKPAGSAYGANDHEYDGNNPRSPYAPSPATPMALKDCNQKLSQQQT